MMYLLRVHTHTATAQRARIAQTSGDMAGGVVLKVVVTLPHSQSMVNSSRTAGTLVGLVLRYRSCRSRLQRPLMLLQLWLLGERTGACRGVPTPMTLVPLLLHANSRGSAASAPWRRCRGVGGLHGGPSQKTQVVVQALCMHRQMMAVRARPAPTRVSDRV